MFHDIQQCSAAAFCDKCRQEIYHGEVRFAWEGHWICPDCFRASVEAMKLIQLAEELGVEVEAL